MTESMSATAYGGLHEAAAVLAWYIPSAIVPVTTAGDIDLLLLDSDVTVDARLERRWTLSTDVRVQVLRRLRQEGRIGDALAANPQRPTEPIQAFLDRYLTGDRPPIDELNLAELVIVRTICEWLRPAGFDDLPAAESLTARLEWLLLLQPLETLAAGRQPEEGVHLGTLRDLVRPHATSTLANLDGAGSSAAAARFLLDRARAGHPIAYLDLSRPDVRPPALLPVLLETARQLLVQFPRAADRCAPILLEWQRQLTSSGGITDEEIRGWSGDFTAIIDGAELTRTQTVLVLDETREAAGLSRTVAQLQEHLPQLRICVCRRQARRPERPRPRNRSHWVRPVAGVDSRSMPVQNYAIVSTEGRDTHYVGADLAAASRVFVGRDLTQLFGLLSEAAAGVVVVQAAVYGIGGGIGKTELALQYARESAGRRRYRRVWWVTADTADNVGLGLAASARRLRPDETLADAQSWAVGWLQSNVGWLLVLDNVEDVDHIAGLLGQVAGRGHVLMTTRRDLGQAQWARLGLSPLRLDVLNRAASVEMLVAMTGLPAGPGTGRLAADLGDLPLALEQAGAYISQHDGLDYDDYRLLLRSQFAVVSAPGGASNRNAARVWQLTMDAVRSRSALADRVMRVLAWMAPEALPGNVLLALTQNPGELDDALAVLASYNMISRNVGAVGVHRLVQAIIRAETPADNLDEAVRVLAAAVPDDPIDTVAAWPQWNALLPHIDAVLSHLPATHTNVDALYVAGGAANYRRLQGQTATAIVLFEQLVTDTRRLFGADHPNTLETGGNLAFAYRDAGRVGEAIAVLEQVLADYRRAFGDDHLGTLTTGFHLGDSYRRAGRVGEAIVLFEQLVIDARRVFGDDHPDTLAIRGNLAFAYRDAGRVGEAIVLFEQLVIDARRLFGDDHPRTLTTRFHLGDAYQGAGRVGEAIEMFEQVLAGHRRVFGEDHPDTLAIRGNLALAYQRAGRVAEAIAVFEQVLADYLRVFGEDHPGTRTTSRALADAYLEAGRDEDSIAMLEQPFVDRLRVADDVYPDVRTILGSLAIANSGRDEASVAFELALMIHMRTGRVDEAISMYERLLTRVRQEFGDDSPEAARILRGLTAIRSATNGT